MNRSPTSHATSIWEMDLVVRRKDDSAHEHPLKLASTPVTNIRVPKVQRFLSPANTFHVVAG